MLINKLQKKFSSQFLRNAGWLGLGELANRIFRLGTTVTLARMFSPGRLRANGNCLYSC